MFSFRIHNCEQGTPEWDKARLGKITGSVMSQIITKTGKRSASLEGIVNRAVAELILGVADETFQSDSMLRGKELESEALDFFNFVHGYSFAPCGFLAATDSAGNDLGYGVSPDGLQLSESMGLELKCPEAHTHLAYLAKGALPDEYKQQVQAALMVSGFEKWVFGSYHPSLPCFKTEVLRDEPFIKEMRPLVLEACEAVKEKYLMIKQMVEAASA